MSRSVIPMAMAATLLVTSTTGIWFCRDGALGVIPDVLIWPNLRSLTAEEDDILTPFVTKVHDLIWAGAMAMAACFCVGFLTGWFLRAWQPRHVSCIVAAAFCGLSTQTAMGERHAEFGPPRSLLVEYLCEIDRPYDERTKNFGCVTDEEQRGGRQVSIRVLESPSRADPATDATLDDADPTGAANTKRVRRLWHGNRITPEQPFPARVIGVIPSWVGYALLLEEIVGEKPRYCVAYLWATQKLEYRIVASKEAFIRLPRPVRAAVVQVR